MSLCECSGDQSLPNIPNEAPAKAAQVLSKSLHSVRRVLFPDLDKEFKPCLDKDYNVW